MREHPALDHVVTFAENGVPSIHFDRYAVSVGERVWRAVHRMAFGLAAVNAMQESDYSQVQHAVEGIRIPGQHLPTFVDARADVRAGLVEQALSSWVDDLNRFLDEALFALLLLELLDLARHHVNPTSWSTIVEAAARTFNAFDLPTKIRELTSGEAGAKQPAQRDMVDSINRARVCLVHRAGTVAAKDCNADAALKVSWEEDDVELRIGGQPFVPADAAPVQILVGEGMEPRHVIRQRAKTFAIGERLSFTAREVAWMGATVARFCEGIAASVAQLASNRTDVTLVKYAPPPMTIQAEEVGPNRILAIEDSPPSEGIEG